MIGKIRHIHSVNIKEDICVRCGTRPGSLPKGDMWVGVGWPQDELIAVRDDGFIRCGDGVMLHNNFAQFVGLNEETNAENPIANVALDSFALDEIREALRNMIDLRPHGGGGTQAKREMLLTQINRIMAQAEVSHAEKFPRKD